MEAPNLPTADEDDSVDAIVVDLLTQKEIEADLGMIYRGCSLSPASVLRHREEGFEYAGTIILKSGSGKSMWQMLADRYGAVHWKKGDDGELVPHLVQGDTSMMGEKNYRVMMTGRQVGRMSAPKYNADGKMTSTGEILEKYTELDIMVRKDEPVEPLAYKHIRESQKVKGIGPKS